MWRKRSSMTQTSENVEFNPNQAIKQHGEKVLNTIGQTIGSIDDLSKTFPDLNKMGYTHYKYGTRVEHFQVISYDISRLVNSETNSFSSSSCGV